MRNALGNQLQALATRPEGENPVCSYPLKSADVLSAIRKCDNLTRIPLTGSDYTIRQLLHYLNWMAVCPKFVTIASDRTPCPPFAGGWWGRRNAPRGVWGASLINTLLPPIVRIEIWVTETARPGTRR